MASANRNVKRKVVTKTVEVEEEVETFTLTLNREEAEVVMALVGSISGNNRFRNAASEVYWAMSYLPGLEKSYSSNPAVALKRGTYPIEFVDENA